MSNLGCIGRSMCSRPQFTELTYLGGTGPCGPMTIVFCSVIKSQYISLNIKYGVNRTPPQFTDLRDMELYGRYQIVRGQIPTNVWIIQAFVENVTSIALYVRYLVYNRRTYRHSSNLLEFRADQMHRRNLRSQINIYECYTRIDKTNIPTMRRV